MVGKILSIFFIISLFIGCGGCNLLGNVGGWNLDACENNFSTCFELYWDNSTRINSSFITALSGG
jgi:hypothetical protein